MRTEDFLSPPGPGKYISNSFTLHIRLEYDGSAYLVHQGLVAAGHLAYTGVQHGALGHHGGEALVPLHNGNLGITLAPAVDKGNYVALILRRLPVGLHRHANHDTVHRLSGHLAAQVVPQAVSLHRAQTVSNNLRGVGCSQPRAFPAIVNSQDSAHQLRPFLNSDTTEDAIL